MHCRPFIFNHLHLCEGMGRELKTVLGNTHRDRDIVAGSGASKEAIRLASGRDLFKLVEERLYLRLGKGLAVGVNLR